MRIFLNKIFPEGFYILTVLLSIGFFASFMTNYTTSIPASLESPKNISDDFYYETSSGKILAQTYAKSNTAKDGITYKLTTTLPYDLPDNYALQFYTQNSWVSVYASDSIIYEVSPEQFVGIGNSPGSFWNIVSVPSWAYGKTLTIKFTPAYNSHSSLIKFIYKGSLLELFRVFLKNRIFSVLISIIDLLIGFSLLLFGFLDRKDKVIHSILYLGFLSIFLGIHSLCETDILSFFYSNTQLLQYLNLLAYALVPFPCLHYCMLENKILPSRRRNLLESIPIFNFFLILFLHFTRLMDFDISLMFTSITAIFTIITILYYSCKEFFQNRFMNLRSNFSFFGAIILMICIAIDLVGYYVNPLVDSSTYTRLALLIYLLLAIYRYVKRTLEILHIGLHSETLKQTAYLDSLTGLGNRTSLNKDMENFENNLLHSQSVGIIQFDINYLKKVNDTLGHVAGDRLIQNAAAAISEGFSDYGKCYRFGGDEFVVILVGNAKEKYSFGIQTLERYLEQLNETLPKEEQVSVAYGIAYYDSSIDTSLWHAQERADAIMYERKRKLKKKLNSNYKDTRL